MEIVFVIFMIVAGFGVATLLLVILSLSGKREVETATEAAIDRDLIASSILFQLARLGGAEPSRAEDIVRTIARTPHLSKVDVDVFSWGNVYRRASSVGQREQLLELAVLVAMATGSQLPLSQYNALLDLSFGLGFQTDALARLRARHPFTYEDHAKRGRPRSADRGGGSVPLFVSQETERNRLLSILGLGKDVTRNVLISTYRKLAAQNHPDRYFQASVEEQTEAAARFIEITEAYQRLLALLEGVEEGSKV